MVLENTVLHKRVFLHAGRHVFFHEITSVAVEWWRNVRAPAGSGFWLVRVEWSEGPWRQDSLGWLFHGSTAYDEALSMFDAAEPGMAVDGSWYKELKKVAV